MFAFTPPIPVLETERTLLRAPELADFEAVAGYFASERSAGNGGPHNRTNAWRFFSANIGHWFLRGYGLWMMIDRASGANAGWCGLWCPEGWVEPEIAWTVFDGFEGRGLAREAAARVLTHAFGTLGWETLASPINPANARSVGLALRLGAVPDGEWTTPGGHPAIFYRFRREAA